MELFTCIFSSPCGPEECFCMKILEFSSLHDPRGRLLLPPVGVFCTAVQEEFLLHIIFYVLFMVWLHSKASLCSFCCFLHWAASEVCFIVRPLVFFLHSATHDDCFIMQLLVFCATHVPWGVLHRAAFCLFFLTLWSLGIAYLCSVWCFSTL